MKLSIRLALWLLGIKLMDKTTSIIVDQYIVIDEFDSEFRLLASSRVIEVKEAK